MFCFDRCPFDDEEVETITSSAQIKTEDVVVKTFELWRERYTFQQRQTYNPSAFHPLQPPPDLRILSREKHYAWLVQSLKTPPDRTGLAAIHTWVVYWIIQSLALLDTSPILSPEDRLNEEEEEQKKKLQLEEEAQQKNQLNNNNNTNKSDTTDEIVELTTSLPLSQTSTPITTIWTKEFGLEMIEFMKRFEHPNGGYAGHFGGDAHMLTSYAAIMSIVIIGTRCGVYEQAYKSINIPKLLIFMKTLKVNEKNDENYGAYHTCPDGEVDTRSVFAAMVILDLLGELPNEDLTDGTAKWLSTCQNYDGGFSCEPGVESHGGYTLTALAALVSLESTHLINLDLLEKWCVNKQMEREGGFCGRTHKLVDSCYSFWVGATIPLIQLGRQQLLDRSNGKSTPTANFNTQKSTTDFNTQKSTTNPSELRTNPSELGTQAIGPEVISNLPRHTTTTTPESELPKCGHEKVILPPTQLGWMFDQQALQSYICIVCQHGPGFKDKPGVSPDYYHTCYSLSGLAISHTSVSFQKLSYSYINQPEQQQSQEAQQKSLRTPQSQQQKQQAQIPGAVLLEPKPLQSPTTSEQSPILTKMYNQVNNIDPNVAQNTKMEDIPITTSSSSSSSSSSLPKQSPNPLSLPLPQETIDLIDKHKHPTVFRLGGTQAKLQLNNVLYNIPQGCYIIAHAHHQRLKQEKQHQQPEKQQE